ncbi:MAG: formylglycine-generating enzyme family protein [Rhodobacteraceae bacterium]|nr:formylglycine-generating enzyme family protein [Paracoccaceae bacterium]
MTNAQSTCCSPSLKRPKGPVTDIREIMPSGRSIPSSAAHIPAGPALRGTATEHIPDDGEGPLKKLRHKAFRMAETTVTNAEFQEFIDATGYVTEAEKFGWSFVFWSEVPDEIKETQGVMGIEWWRRVDGATWANVNGPGCGTTAWHADHPVVQVSWKDARAYAVWAGGRLPTEAEWEHAARGGLGDVKFPWGDKDPNDTDHTPCNIWQGDFPNRNTAEDGYKTTAPAKSFEPNGYGLYNLVGNVWEWTSDTYKIASLKKSVKARLKDMRGFRLSKGGSFLCHRSYCYRYRIAARSGTSPDSATTHQGFRMVWDDRG